MRINRTLAKINSLVSYFLILCLMYAELSAKGLLDYHFFPKKFLFLEFIFSILSTVLVSIFLKGNPKKSSHYFEWLMAIFTIVPILVFFSFGGGDLIYFSMTLLSFFGIGFLSRLRLGVRLHTIVIANPIAGIWTIVFLFLITIISAGNYSSIDYTFENIYANRAILEESNISVFPYLNNVLSKCLLPILLLYYYLRNNIPILLLIFVACLSMFFLSQHRAAIFFPFLVMFCYFGANQANIRGGWVIVIPFASVLVLSYFLIQHDVLYLVGDILSRRTFLDPAAMGYEFFRYFYVNPHTFFSDTKLSLGLINPVYPVQVPYIISDEIGLLGGHANSGYLGSGFQQVGYFGVAFYSVVIAVVFRISNYLGDKIGNHSYVFSVFAPSMIWIFNSSDLPSVFLTHGLLLAIVTLYISSDYIGKHLLPEKIKVSILQNSVPAINIK